MQRKNDKKVFLSLILWMLIPSIYLLIRMNMVSVNHVDINILGQMEWFDLIDEIITTSFIFLKTKSPGKMVLHSYCHLGCIFCLQ